MNESLRQVGGARIGRGLIPINFSAPFAVLVADEKRLEVSISIFVYRRKYRIPKSSVDGIVDVDGIFSKGLQIQHHQQTEPSFIVFWTSERSKIKEMLARFGYPVK